MYYYMGEMDITDNINVVNSIINAPNVMIVNLDEDSKISGNNVLGGACLLPPPDAVIAEINGDPGLYDTIYGNYLANEEFVAKYITALISYLHNGGNILFYIPELKLNESALVPSFASLMMNIYGLGIGIYGVNHVPHNVSKIPNWGSLMYNFDIIGARQFLMELPTGLRLSDNDMFRCIMDIRPCGDFQQKQQQIYSMITKLKQNPNVKEALYAM